MDQDVKGIKLRWTPALVFLVLVNLLPVVGVFVFGWDIATILALYWLETIIIGALNIPKMWACEGGIGSKVFITVFFMVHFGMFCAGHLIFLNATFNTNAVLATAFDGGPLTWTALSLLISHTFSMMINFFAKREYEGRQPNEQMFFPYGRIVVMHIVIIFGGFLALILGAPIAALLLLIVLKTGMDIVAHSLEHSGKPMHTMG